MAELMNYFRLLGLPEQFRTDAKALESGYRRVELQVHPDRFISATPAMRRAAEQFAVRANEAYETLSDPLKRAVYMCELAGVPLEAEKDTRMPVEFLMQQMQWRETFEAVRGNAGALAGLGREVDGVKLDLIGKIAAALDDAKSPKDAVPLVRSLMFVDKMARGIAAALSQN